MTLRTHGITKENMQFDFPDAKQQGAWYYEMQYLGYNYRITDIQAALGNSQLKRADEGIKRRHAIADKYRKEFEALGIKMQKNDKNYFNAYHLFVVEVKDRLGLYNFLKDKGIFAQIHYVPVHLMPYYKQFGWNEGDMPNAEDYYKHCISLPMYPTLSDQEQDFVIETVKKFINTK
jgi:dTDP-4-amino-4,6-dideoxygalactose transaminase